MVWGELGPEPVPDQHAESLCAAPFDEVVEDVAAVVGAVLPHAVVSYDARGGYGHPDHIRAHHAARVAAGHLGVPFYTIEELAADAPADDALHLVDVGAVLERKTEAMRAHRTQLTVHGDTFSLSSGPRRPIASVEAFRRWESAEQPEEPSFGSAPLGSRVFASVLALVLGLAVGALGTITHQVEVTLAAVAIPVGVALALAVAGCLLLGLRLVFGSRTPALLASAGLVVTLIVLGQAGPGGSVLIPANIAGYVWTYGVPLFAAVVLAWPRLRTLSGSRGAGG
jgi:N-acetyl-1-D-myo-inositol-2-amino-2-deoxy-alpha-D-glucopyranoside deacetylase